MFWEETRPPRSYNGAEGGIQISRRGRIVRLPVPNIHLH